MTYSPIWFLPFLLVTLVTTTTTNKVVDAASLSSASTTGGSSTSSTSTNSIVRTFSLPNFDIESIVIDPQFDFELFRTSFTKTIDTHVDSQLRQILLMGPSNNSSNSTDGTSTGTNSSNNNNVITSTSRNSTSDSSTNPNNMTNTDATYPVSSNSSITKSSSNRSIITTWESLQKATYDNINLDVVYVRGIPPKKGQNLDSTLVVGHYSGSVQLTFTNNGTNTNPIPDPNITTSVLDTVVRQLFQGPSFDMLRVVLRTHPILSTIIAMRISVGNDLLLSIQIAPIPPPRTNNDDGEFKHRGALIAALLIAIICGCIAVYLICFLRQQQKAAANNPTKKLKLSWKRPHKTNNDDEEEKDGMISDDHVGGSTGSSDNFVDEDIMMGSSAAATSTLEQSSIIMVTIPGTHQPRMSAPHHISGGQRMMNRSSSRRLPRHQHSSNKKNKRRLLPPGERHPRATTTSVLSSIHEVDHESSEFDFNYTTEHSGGSITQNDQPCPPTLLYHDNDPEEANSVDWNNKNTYPIRQSHYSSSSVRSHPINTTTTTTRIPTAGDATSTNQHQQHENGKTLFFI